MKTFTLVLGGTQGDGMVSAGAILSRVLSRSGYYTYTHRTFASRIKGGHTRSRIEITPYRNMACGSSVDLAIAFDKTTAERDFDFSPIRSLRIIDKSLGIPSTGNGANNESIHLPMSEASDELGNRLAKTTVALGILCRMLGLDEKLFTEMLREKYGGKGEKTLETNLQAFDAGLSMAAGSARLSNGSLRMEAVPRVRRPVMTGNYAIALGALSGGCNFVSAYPITPASEIMEYLSAKLPPLGGLMVQTEDEIAALAMAIGASYGGARGMSATSGPGLSLMLEAIGLSAMAEIPIVLVDSQRVGPSTGLPTKVEQSDFDAALYGGHGEYPSIVMSPYSVETCFSMTREAFLLADRYSCPVILMSDLALGLFPQTVDPFPDQESAMATDESSQSSLGDGPYFRRYDSGETKRPLPGTAGGIHYTTGLEHGPLGAPDNSPENRLKMMERRMEKFASLSASPAISLDGKSGRILLIATGSAYGVCKRALESLGDSVVLGAIHRLKPFPARQLADLSRSFESILVVEYNYEGQLFELFRKNIPPEFLPRLHSLRKYSGEPFSTAEITNKTKELI